MCGIGWASPQLLKGVDSILPILHETGLIAFNIRTLLVEGLWSGILQGQVIKIEDFLSARVKKIWNSLRMKL